MDNHERTLPGRRRFLRLAAASGAMAGISGVSLSAAEDLIARFAAAARTRA